MRRADKVGDRIFVDGNTAAALGCVYGGATVCAWYPITPSSSVAEAFQSYCKKLRHDPATGEARYAIVQAEDEIASINACVGAALRGWLAQGQRLRNFNRTMALVLMATALWMLRA